MTYRRGSQSSHLRPEKERRSEIDESRFRSRSINRGSDRDGACTVPAPLMSLVWVVTRYFTRSPMDPTSPSPSPSLSGQMVCSSPFFLSIQLQKGKGRDSVREVTMIRSKCHGAPKPIPAGQGSQEDIVLIYSRTWGLSCCDYLASPDPVLLTLIHCRAPTLGAVTTKMSLFALSKRLWLVLVKTLSPVSPLSPAMTTQTSASCKEREGGGVDQP